MPVVETSLLSYIGEKKKFDSQAALLEYIYNVTPQGLTDQEMKMRLRRHDIDIPLSSVSGRRNDINKKAGQVVVMHRVGDYRQSACNRKHRVWRHRKYYRGGGI